MFLTTAFLIACAIGGGTGPNVTGPDGKPVPRFDGRIEGRVRNSENQSLRNMEVTLQRLPANRPDSVVQKTVTDANGRFEFLYLPPGQYEARGHKKGWTPWRRRVSLSTLEQHRHRQFVVISELTRWSLVAWGLRMVSLTYLILLGLVVMSMNIVAPRMSREVIIGGWVLIAIGFAIAVLRAGWTEASILGAWGCLAGFLIHRIGNRAGARHELEDRHMAEQRQQLAEQEAATVARLIGQHGETVSALKPYGEVVIDGKRLEAKSEQGLIPIDARVQVTRLDGFRPVVRIA